MNRQPPAAAAASPKLNGFMARRPTDGLFECLLCKKGYGRASALHAHFKEDHLDRGWFPCPRCDDDVPKADMAELAQHVMTHTKISHACPDCDAVLNTRSALDVHKLVNHKAVSV